MNRPREDSRGGGTKRRWRIPPPLVQDADAPGPEGLAILDELRSELGAVLWKSLRSVLVWAASDPSYRRNLFVDGAAERRQLEILAAVPADESPLRDALENLLPLLGRPDRADPEFVGVACHRIATWAERQGANRTRLEFLQAAALCCPANGWFALYVGNASRDLAHYSRAEAWYFRAIGLARQASDWEAYVRAYLNHGIMMTRRGALPAARRSFLKALRRARRQNFREGEAKALHDLSHVEFRGGSFGRADTYASEAIETYGPGHEGLPRLAHDIAYYWLERGHHSHALAVFYETLGRVSASERPVVLGSIARAAAGAGDEGGYRWAHAELSRSVPGPGLAEAWVDVARAALFLGMREEAREAAALAESVARSRGEGQVRFLAGDILHRIEEEARAATVAETPSDSADIPGPTADELARKLIRTLQFTPVREGARVGAV
jgi:tetratricopeptide (TPR) repeat protein